ncbi:hypothetical protein PAN31117_05076 [Pandoraea anapnoica]|uniref:Uncharacterized protein n=1 Tax=Pandoraea anapnoica TaxID=2508301 RepID=A0A5E5AMT7_9BURK|nr:MULTISPECIES: hypothetical protein [Pandoraea]VVE58570.1 hypothetical protein PIN31009_05324 [Pandoraea iniqua]VVE75081.1 hypothetical protein PAN31117_05076 [Pandoraea anapnoica]
MALLIGTAAHADQTVAFAGLAYAGDAAQIDARYPVTRSLDASLRESGNPAGKTIIAELKAHPPQNFAMQYAGMASLNGSDQALATALVITNETISDERFGDMHKVLVGLRAQALVFDFRAMKIVRAYPLAATYLDVMDHVPTKQESRDRVLRLLLGDTGKPGLFSRYAEVMSKAALPDSGSKYLQVAHVGIPDAALAHLPSALQAPGAAQAWLADMMSEAMLNKSQVPMLPYSAGYAIGNAMAMRFSDGDIFNLKLPAPDYSVDIDLKGFKRVDYGSSSAGSSYIYATYSHIKLAELMSGTTYLDADFKNGEVKNVPVTQSQVDDLPAYAESARGLFDKLASALAGDNSDWLSAAASGEHIKNQIDNTRGVLKSCK